MILFACIVTLVMSIISLIVSIATWIYVERHR